MATSHSSKNSPAEEAVAFVDSKMLDPSQPPSQISAKVLADQAAAMMVQDMRTFLQANEQIITVGIGKAIAMTLDSHDPAIQKGGQEALAALQKLLLTLPQFAGEVETVAHSILTQFGDPKAHYQKRSGAAPGRKTK